MTKMARLPPIVFGHALRGLWDLADGATFLNHGSFGACPKPVLRAYRALQAEMEAAPDQFIEGRIMPNGEQTALRTTIDRVARFAGTSGARCALVENATVGIQCILESIDLQPGDTILLTNHQYPAVLLAAAHRCRRSGASVRIATIPSDSTPNDIVDRIGRAATGSVKLAIIDHISSATAMLFPVDDIVRSLREKGVPTLIDGAHAIGQIPLDIEAIGADWYVSNAHKWLYACRGTALLQATDEAASITRPLIASHFVDLGFPRAFDYPGTRDYCGWLALPHALDFFEALEPDALRAHTQQSIFAAIYHLSAAGATPASTPRGLAMQAFVLPQRRPVEATDVAWLKERLWSQARIQVGANAFDGQLLLRISAQAYVDDEDFHELAVALDRIGWPGR
jgi:isopenicillin-N epimerase